jgi:hypothetical protein
MEKAMKYLAFINCSKRLFSFSFTLLFSTFVWLFFLLPSLADTPQFSKPVDCIPGEECIIQQYVDLDPSSATLDYKCAQQTYNGHKGTDFRLVNARVYQRGIDVIASAPGTILRVRDGVADRLIRTNADRALVRGKECGNGLVIDHGNGWESQYCHLKKDSLLVRSGQTVSRGETLGLVGLSGKTQMPHVHLTIRHDGAVVDPFTGGKVGSSVGETSCNNSGNSLWDYETLRAFPYTASHIMEVGFTSRVLKSGTREIYTNQTSLTSYSDKLILFVRVANFLKGDQIKLLLTGPAGFKAEHLAGPLKRNKARFKAVTGKKRRANTWAKGTYVGMVTILRENEIIHTKEISLELTE